MCATKPIIEEGRKVSLINQIINEAYQLKGENRGDFEAN